jgi:hypothetical protein
MIGQYKACQISDYCRFARLWFKVSSLSLHCFESSISLHTRFYISQLEMLSIRLMKATVIEKATLRKNVHLQSSTTQYTYLKAGLLISVKSSFTSIPCTTVYFEFFLFRYP